MERERKNNVLNVPFRNLGIITMLFPTFATLFAIYWSLVKDYEGSTATHCKVYNFLPSLSAAIGRPPQRYIWRICITMHASPRFAIALAYLGWHKMIYVGHQQRAYIVTTFAAIALHIFENSMLILLTSVSSNENKTIHEGSFILFIISSWIYMLLTIALTKWRLKDESWKQNKQLLKSYKLKKIFAFMNIAGFLLATYLYFRHNWYCEPAIYSYFAFFEYMTIFTNIAFHGTAIIDLRDYSVAVVLTDLLQKHT